MQLKEALAVAVRFTSKAGEGPAYDAVVIRDGAISATSGFQGCQIACEGIEDIEAAVNCEAFFRMVRAVDDPTLKVTKKGLEVKGSGVSYSIKTLSEDKVPTFPEPPKKGWAEYTEEQAKALGAIARIVDPSAKASNPAFAGVRLTPDWCAGVSRDSACLAWISGLVDEPFTSPPGIFDGLSDGGEIAVSDGRLYLRSEGQTRWSLGLVAEFPDESISGAVVKAREEKRSKCPVSLSDFGLLARQAQVVAADKLQGFKLSIDGLKMKIRLAGAQDIGEFAGFIDVSEWQSGGPEDFAGVSPDRLAQLCDIVGSVCEKGRLSIAGPLHPILLWGGEEVIIEAMMMPVRLPE